MLDKSFNRGIRNIITILEYPMYIVARDIRYRCPCMDHNDVPDPGCKKCLGTGYKIKIKKVLGVMEPDEVSVRLSGQQQKIASNYYYFNAEKVKDEYVQPGNIVVREQEADILQSPKKYRSDSNKVIYYYVEAVNMKSNRDLFLKNFWKLVRP